MGAIRLGPALAGALYLLLVASAALALWVAQSPGVVDRGLELVAPWLFLLFALGFAGYRWALVRAKKYPAGKAFFQVGTAALFFMLLLPGARRPQPEGVPGGELELLLNDANPAVRALAAEVVRSRPDGALHAPTLARALGDPDARVRAQAHTSLVKLAGVDLGAPDQEGAVEAWQKKYP